MASYIDNSYSNAKYLVKYSLCYNFTLADFCVDEMDTYDSSDTSSRSDSEGA